jgi:hypothetical protein
LGGGIEGDATLLGGPRPGKRGRGAGGKTLVLIAAQADGRKVGRMVEPGSSVRTDAWKGYHGLVGLGYVPRVIRETAEPGAHLLSLANRVASLWQRWLLGTHPGAVRASHWDDDVDAFTVRFNRRTSRSGGLLWYRLRQQSVALDPVLTRSLVGGCQDHKPWGSLANHA